MTSLNTFDITVASTGLTTASTAYTDGDQLGAIETFLISGNPAGLIITNARLVDKANIVGAIDAFIFDRSVTLASDNAAGPAVSDADALFHIDTIEFPYPKLAGNNRISSLDSLAITVKPAVAATGFFVGLVTRSGHTFFGAAGDLSLRLSGTLDV